jgi:glucokinase
MASGRPSILADLDEIPTARSIAQAAQQGDELAIEAFQIAGDYLGRAIADFLHLYNPTIVILGGGVTKAGEFLMAPVRRSLTASVISPMYLENFTLTTASLGEQVGLVGALALARS